MNNTIERLSDGTLVFLPERLNRDPAVLRGLTNDEMWVALGTGAVIGLLLGVPLAIATASIAVAPTSMIACMAVVLFTGGTLLRRAKRARPETWLYRKLEWRLASALAAGSRKCDYALRCLDGSPLKPSASCPVPVATMSRFRNKVDAQQAHIFSLRLAVVIVALVCAGLWYGWRSAPTDLTVHVPPDLRSGSTRKWWDIPSENVYAFALYIFGQLNRWPVGWRAR